jgi:hypothetical protein
MVRLEYNYHYKKNIYLKKMTTKDTKAKARKGCNRSLQKGVSCEGTLVQWRRIERILS